MLPHRLISKRGKSGLNIYFELAISACYVFTLHEPESVCDYVTHFNVTV